ARAHVREDHGDLLIDRDALGRLNRTDPDPCSRILLGALHWIGGGPYGPRRDERERLLANVFEARPCTLGGCRLNHEGGTLRITREVAACAPPGPAAEVWDGRWHLTGPMADHLTVGALGEDIVATPWREAKLPRSSLLASPAIRDGTRLIAAPLAGLSKGWRAQTRLPFVLSLLER
ncbi:MAG: tRNA lysidine(34) synthetase TilS, partial [Pseudomonadota bacterium]